MTDTVEPTESAGAARPESPKLPRARQIPPTFVVAELNRILTSETFDRADRPQRFLKFLVERMLAGDSDRLTEYTLAAEVFDRPPSFDPATDPIVRVEAGRLRRKLKEYYMTEGREHSVVIELPPRTYIPVVRALPEFAPTKPSRRWTRLAYLPWRLAILGAGGGLALAIATAFLGWWLGARASRDTTGNGAPPAVARSIVVLPFADLSPNHDQEYFCSGLTEELTDVLTNVEGLQVVASTTAQHFKRTTEDVRLIGKELNVGLVLEGSVRKAGQRLRIVAELTNAANGYDLWSRTYDRDLKDVIAVQEEIAAEIATTVRSELGGRRRAAAQSPVKSKAYDSYLKGIYSTHDWSAEGLMNAVADLERSIATDPNYAPAHAALAECYALLGLYSGLPPQDVMPKAKAAALRALKLDDSLSGAYSSLATVQAVYDWDWPAAQRSFHCAYELGSPTADDREMYAVGFLMPQGRLDEALHEIEEARSQDPLSLRLRAVLGRLFYYRRQYDRALEIFRTPLEGGVADSSAATPGAISAIADAHAARPVFGAPLLGDRPPHQGSRAETEKLIQDLIRLSATRFVSPVSIANLYAALGDRDRAMEWLEKAFAIRATSLAFLKVEPRFDNVRGDARFVSLLARIHLE